MSLFRRGPKVDRTQPLPAPEGTKWVVSKSLIRYEGGRLPVLQLGLWPLAAEPDEWGKCTTPHPGNKEFAKGCPIPRSPLAYALFERDREIHSASKRALAQYKTDDHEAGRFTRLRTTIR